MIRSSTTLPANAILLITPVRMSLWYKYSLIDQGLSVVEEYHFRFVWHISSPFNFCNRYIFSVVRNMLFASLIISDITDCCFISIKVFTLIISRQIQYHINPYVRKTTLSRLHISVPDNLVYIGGIIRKIY